MAGRSSRHGWVMAAALLAGCTSATVQSADAHFERQEFDAAVRMYELALAREGPDAEVSRRLALARQNGAAYHAALADQAVTRGDLNRAGLELSRARELDPESTAYAQAAAAVQATWDAVTATLARAAESPSAQERFEALESVQRYAPSFADLGARLEAARTRLAEERLAAVRDAATRAAWEEAEAALAAARAVVVAETLLATRVAQAGDALQVARLLAQAAAEEQAGALRNALHLYERAAAVPGADAAAAEALSRARAQLVAQLLDEAQRALAGGDAVAACALLAQAVAVDPTSAAVAEQGASIRRAGAAAMVARAADARDRELVGLEWLRLQQAVRIDPTTPGLEALRADCRRRLVAAATPTILVRPFTNAAFGAGPVQRLRDDVMRQLQTIAEGGAPASIVDDARLALRRQSDPDLTPDLVVGGTLERFSVVRYPDRLQSATQQYARQVDFHGWRDNKPHHWFGTVWRSYVYTIREARQVATASLTLEVYDVAQDRVCARRRVERMLEERDRIVEGHAEAGVADDPDELSPSSMFAERLYEELCAELEGAVREELGWTARGLRSRFDRFRDAGNLDAALSTAMLILDTQYRSRRAPDMDVVDYIQRQTGYQAWADELDLTQLR